MFTFGDTFLALFGWLWVCSGFSVPLLFDGVFWVVRVASRWSSDKAGTGSSEWIGKGGLAGEAGTGDEKGNGVDIMQMVLITMTHDFIAVFRTPLVLAAIHQAGTSYVHDDRFRFHPPKDRTHINDTHHAHSSQ